jgi:hypothetical protein
VPEGESTPPDPRWPPSGGHLPRPQRERPPPFTLPHLLSQDYPGAGRVIVVDGGSTDRTGDIARQVARTASPAPPFP